MKLVFSGSSDDTFGEYGAFNVDHDNCANGKPIVYRVSRRGENGEEGFYVVGMYSAADNGCWMIGIQQLDEDESIPDWPMRWNSIDHTALLEIDVPDDVGVVHEP